MRDSLTMHETVAMLERLTAAGLSVKLTGYRTRLGNYDGRPKAEWDGPVAFEVSISPDIGVAAPDDIAALDAICREYGLTLSMRSVKRGLALKIVHIGSDDDWRFYAKPGPAIPSPNTPHVQSPQGDPARE